MSSPPVEELLLEVWAHLDHPAGARSGVRIGLDVVDVTVLRRQLESEVGTRFVASRFTPSEIEDARGRPDRLATRWAIKEAVAKAIGTGFREGLRPISIEVLTKPSGAVSVRPSSGVDWPRNAANWSWAVSACHESDAAAAIAIAVLPHHQDG